MLKPVRQHPHRRGVRGTVAIVASRYNARYVDAMVRAARAGLRAAGVQIQVVRVPGAFEIPVVAARWARTRSAAAVVCLGVIFRGETAHAAHIGEAVSRALMQIAVETGVPMIHEVLLLENEAQARVRCCDPRHNRGREAAQTALAMMEVMRGLPEMSGGNGGGE